MKRIYPLPEVFKGDPWVVRPGRGECDTVNRVLAVPLDDTTASRFIRNHEMGHSRITPRVPAYKLCRKHGVSSVALQVIEDMRVHHFLQVSGVAMTGTLSFQDAEFVVRRQLHDERTLAASLCSAWNTADANLLINLLSEEMPEEVLHQLLMKIRMIYNRLKSGKGITRWIGLRNCTIPAAKLFDALFPPAGERPGDCGNIPLAAFHDGRVGGKWGEMTVRSLPKSLTREVSPISQRKIYTDSGSRLAALYRLPVDGRVFVQRKRAVGGTVLIDGSGSMSLTTSDLRRIVSTAPAATIAIYSGRGKKGTLTIIGSKGRVVSDAGLRSARTATGNVVDGPALKWLAFHDAPRIWISDGMVTGERDSASLDLAVEAQRICTDHQIKRVEKADAVVDLLKAVTLGRRWHGLS